MNAFETAARIEDPSHLALSSPLPRSAGGSCRVIVLFDDAGEKTWPPGFFDEILIADPAFARLPQGTAPSVAALDA